MQAPTVQVAVDGSDPSWVEVVQTVGAVAGVVGALIAAIVAAYGIRQGRDFQRERAEERRREWLGNRLSRLTQTAEMLLQYELAARQRDARDMARWRFRIESDARALQGKLGDVLFSLARQELDLTTQREFPEIRAAMDQVQEETTRLARELHTSYLGAEVGSGQEAA